MGKKVAIIHTSFVSVNDLRELFTEIVPSVELINIVDDSLLEEVKRNNGLTPDVTRRICNYALQAQTLGVDLIFNQCSSVGEAVDIARKMLRVPYLKVDDPMAEEAVKIGKRISVIATVGSTLRPSTRLVEDAAKKANVCVQVKGCLVEGALDILMREGDRKKHNMIVMDRITQESENSDVIVLAQGSMMALLPYLDKVKVPVLTSPRSGVMGVKKFLDI